MPPKPTRGRTRGHKWVRLDDPIFRATHWVFFGPGATLGPAAQAAANVSGLTSDVAGKCFSLHSFGEAPATVSHVNSDVDPS